MNQRWHVIIAPSYIGNRSDHQPGLFIYSGGKGVKQQRLDIKWVLYPDCETSLAEKCEWTSSESPSKGTALDVELLQKQQSTSRPVIQIKWSSWALSTNHKLDSFLLRRHMEQKKPWNFVSLHEAPRPLKKTIEEWRAHTSLILNFKWRYLLSRKVLLSASFLGHISAEFDQNEITG